MDNSKCVILVPVARYIEPHCDLSLRKLESAGYTIRRLFGMSQIDRARNRLATDALTDGFEELIWIDSDMAFEPQSVDRLREHDLPIVCALYPTKIEKKVTSVLLPGTSEVVFGAEGGLIEIQYAATGFLCTKRQIYLDIQQKEKLPFCNRREGKGFFPFFLPLILQAAGEEHTYLGEDYAFCERARRSGFRIFADTTIRLQHIGMYGYGWEDLGSSVARYSTYRLRTRADDKANP